MSTIRNHDHVYLVQFFVLITIILNGDDDNAAADGDDDGAHADANAADAAADADDNDYFCHLYVSFGILTWRHHGGLFKICSYITQ